MSRCDYSLGGWNRVIAECLLVKPGGQREEWVEYGPWVEAGDESIENCGNRAPVGTYEWVDWPPPEGWPEE